MGDGDEAVGQAEEVGEDGEGGGVRGGFGEAERKGDAFAGGGFVDSVGRVFFVSEIARGGFFFIQCRDIDICEKSYFVGLSSG